MAKHSSRKGQGRGGVGEEGDTVVPHPFRAFARVVAPVELNDPARRKDWGLQPLGSVKPSPYIIELNAQHAQGLPGASTDFHVLYEVEVQRPAEEAGEEVGDDGKPLAPALVQALAAMKLDRDSQGKGFTRVPVRIGKSYYRCELTDAEWKRLVAAEAGKPVQERSIYRIWPDFRVTAQTDRSAATIKADAALNSFGAEGEGITWAVLDSGVDVSHPHFGDRSKEGWQKTHLLLNNEVRDLHRNFADIYVAKGKLSRVPAQPLASPDQGTALDPVMRDALIEAHRAIALGDDFGHGTHVAGIIAGQAPKDTNLRLFEHEFDENAEPSGSKSEPKIVERVPSGKTVPRGMAPRCRIISLRVLDDKGEGRSSQMIQALEYLREQINDNPKVMRVHGVNMSVGYSFDPEIFACGQSPLCTTVNRLVNEGVVVVAAAGNTGFGSAATNIGTRQMGFSNSINDPGNAELAITVGATHRDSPHTYGVSYFSSKGPTTDGRLKPDLVAPGERITSCAAGSRLTKVARVNITEAPYIDDTGTSMAAPHVSGAIAAFLSIRREFIGRPWDVKRIFVESATTLGRERYFEGHGLVDLMRAIQSV